MYKYTIGVTVGDHEYFLDFHHEQPALDAFDQIASSTDNEMEDDYLSVSATGTVTTVSLRRTLIPLRLGDPNQVSY